MRLWRRKREFTCQEMVELVTDYLEGALSARDRARFERHIAGCPHCTTYLEQMRITIRTLGRLPAESVPPDAREALLGAFRDWKDARV
jgi:anti-sigma factor (TIGR02949 family)